MKKLPTIKLLVAVVLIIICSTSFTQYKRIGIIAGMNISDIRISYQNDLTRDFKPSNVYGASAGFLFQSSKNNYFVTNFGLIYSGKGTIMTYVGEKSELRLHYIQMPLIFNFRIPIAGPVYIKGGFGPYASYSFLGKEKYDGLENEDIFSMARKYKGGMLDVDKDEVLKPYNPFDLGLIFGGDVEINLPKGTSLDVRFNYELGVWKISNEIMIDETPINFGYKNNNMSITVAYLFDVTKDNTTVTGVNKPINQ
jgi:hypothetical protein